MHKALSIFFISIVSMPFFLQANPVDEIVFGNTLSEKKHAFSGKESKIIKGGLDESARILLPIEGEPVEGGSMAFTMKVDPEKQNYFTVRFWGSDPGDENILLLFCEGKQVGYRHLGDIDILDRSNNEPPYPGCFFYLTTPLPLQMTKGKQKIELSIRSTGRIWGYGDTLEKYQKAMLTASRAVYNAYTHTDTYFATPKDEKQGKAPQSPPLRTMPNEEIIDMVKKTVNERIDGFLSKDIPSQEELWILADAYYIDWTNAYGNKLVIEKVIAAADNYCRRFAENPKVVYENEWATTGPLCVGIYRFAPETRLMLDEKMNNGKTRRENWSKLFKACLDYAKTHRRMYTNQSMIIDLHMYYVNRALSIVDPENALPAYQTLRYLYESVGISPWLGSETPNGPAKPVGDNYYQLTAQGLTKELGFVGYYGEVLNWVTLIYEATGERADNDSRDPLIRAQLLKMMKARSYFRYPTVDKEGNKAMRAEVVVGWRDGGNYPGNVTYGDRGSSREATPLMTAAATLDPEAVGYAQQMLDDNQFYAMVAGKMEDQSIASVHTLLRIPDEYELIKQQPKQGKRLPMSQGEGDFLFNDEENGVLALKNGDEILYASLYWRARFAINNLARVHYITPNSDRIATVYQDTKFADSGLRYTRPNWVNFGFGGYREFYPGIESANAGEILPIAKIPEGIDFKAGQENIHAGKGEFYTLRYGKYLIGMNCSKNKTFEMEIPKAKKVSAFPSKEIIKGKTISVKFMSTVIFIVEN